MMSIHDVESPIKAKYWQSGPPQPPPPPPTSQHGHYPGRHGPAVTSASTTHIAHPLVFTSHSIVSGGDPRHHQHQHHPHPSIAHDYPHHHLEAPSGPAGHFPIDGQHFDGAKMPVVAPSSTSTSSTSSSVQSGHRNSDSASTGVADGPESRGGFVGMVGAGVDSTGAVAGSGVPSIASAGSTAVQPTYHDLICTHLYHVGFANGAYADMVLRVQWPTGSRADVPGVAGGATAGGAMSPNGAGTAGNGTGGAVGINGSGINTVGNGVSAGLANGAADAGAVNGKSNTAGNGGEGPVSVFRLHRIMVMRSPLLRRLLESEADNGGLYPQEYVLSVADPYITPAGFNIALGHLYSSFSSHLLSSTPPPHKSSLLRSVLASAHFLGLTDLCSLVTDLIAEDVNADTVLGYCLFVDGADRQQPQQQQQHQRPHPSLASHHHPPQAVPMTATPASSGMTAASTSSPSAASATGGTTPAATSSSGAPASSSSSSSSSYGGWTDEIRRVVYEYLTKGAVREVGGVHVGGGWPARASDGYRNLVVLFAQLPFDVLKAVVEDEGFDVAGMERFNFAKEIIAHRARTSPPTLSASEEHVVLSFGGRGGAKGSGVMFVRKGKSANGGERKVWKVQGTS